ncbi:hypothetical protein SH467x_001377 [Pirellulaceae bacterium SH467]
MLEPLTRWVTVQSFEEHGLFQGAVEIIFDNWKWYVGCKGWSACLEECLDKKFAIANKSLDLMPQTIDPKTHFEQYALEKAITLSVCELVDGGTILDLSTHSRIGELRYIKSFRGDCLFDFQDGRKVVFNPANGWALLGSYSKFVDEMARREEWLFNRAEHFLLVSLEETTVDWEISYRRELVVLSKQEAADWIVENDSARGDEVLQFSSYRSVEEILFGAYPIDAPSDQSDVDRASIQSVLEEQVSGESGLHVASNVEVDVDGNTRSSGAKLDLHSIELGKPYGAGEDGLRRDAKIYQLALEKWTNLDIAKKIEELSGPENWESIGDSHVSRRLKEFCLYKNLPVPDRPVGRPRSRRKT